MPLPCSAVPYSGVVRPSMPVTSGDGATITLFSPLFVFTALKKLMLAEEQKQ